jgi:hypothetical protein
MKTSLIKFSNGASPREPYGSLTTILLYEGKATVSLVNHDAKLSLAEGDSVEWSGLIEILNSCICVVTWSRETI